MKIKSEAIKEQRLQLFLFCFYQINLFRFIFFFSSSRLILCYCCCSCFHIVISICSRTIQLTREALCWCFFFSILHSFHFFFLSSFDDCILANRSICISLNTLMCDAHDNTLQTVCISHEMYIIFYFPSRYSFPTLRLRLRFERKYYLFFVVCASFNSILLRNVRVILPFDHSNFEIRNYRVHIGHDANHFDEENEENKSNNHSTLLTMVDWL